MKIMGKKNMLLAYSLAALCVTSTGIGLAATNHWNDASLTPAQIVKTQLSNKTDWQLWKNNWDKIKTDYEQVSFAPGADASRLNFGWYSKNSTNTAQVRVSKNKNMADAKNFYGTCEKGTIINDQQYYTNKVEVTGLKPEQKYWYQVKIDDQWKSPQEYKTGNPNNFSFMYVGDPQIGASKKQTSAEGTFQTQDLAARNDSYNWNKTLNSAIRQHPEINFLVSPGDQINEPAADNDPKKIQLQEYQYAGYLSAAVLRNLPEATSIGNHDSMTTGYKNHFNVPNPFMEESSPTKAGHGYYYTYGNVLFMVINANNYNAADHEALIKKAIAAYPNKKWRIVVMHQDIYGSGLDHSDSDGMLLRTQLTPIYDANHIDVVLQGHDHTYARTYQLSSNGQQIPDFAKFKMGQSGQSHEILNEALKDKNIKQNYLAENKCYTIKDMQQGTLVNPKGTFYMSSNSATGSKYYNLLPLQQDYIAARSQTWRPTYSVINVTADKFTINTYDAMTGTPIDKTYSIIKD
ncbi:purple acid phosphatase family protein [Pectinatus sottacetonis]|uniref:purple acid phosphatase family protein n=1 Tax=Pectinatus sottacetonis TaxID=1002795 RepID=UPI0018C78ADE|nr:metallophosphoesterase family protein [Pectinatus sottacetonis]